jgi:hypothetical protein
MFWILDDDDNLYLFLEYRESWFWIGPDDEGEWRWTETGVSLKIGRGIPLKYFLIRENIIIFNAF